MQVTTEIWQPAQNLTKPISQMGRACAPSIFSPCWEAYAEIDESLPSIILIEKIRKFSSIQVCRKPRENTLPPFPEKPGDFHHPFPNLLPNFGSRQIRQVIIKEDGSSGVRREKNRYQRDIG